MCVRSCAGQRKCPANQLYCDGDGKACPAGKETLLLHVVSRERLLAAGDLAKVNLGLSRRCICAWRPRWTPSCTTARW